MNIVEGLAKFKQRKGLGNKQIAEILGVSNGCVSQYLSGKSGLSLQKIVSLLENGMHLDELFGEELIKKVNRIYFEDKMKEKIEEVKTLPKEQAIMELKKAVSQYGEREF